MSLSMYRKFCDLYIDKFSSKRPSEPADRANIGELSFLEMARTFASHIFAGLEENVFLPFEFNAYPLYKPDSVDR